MSISTSWIRENMLYSPSQRRVSEIQMKVQRALQRLEIPEWYLNKSTKPPKILKNTIPIELRPSPWKRIKLNTNSSTASTNNISQSIETHRINKKYEETPNESQKSYSNIFLTTGIDLSLIPCPENESNKENVPPLKFIEDKPITDLKTFLTTGIDPSLIPCPENESNKENVPPLKFIEDKPITDLKTFLTTGIDLSLIPCPENDFNKENVVPLKSIEDKPITDLNNNETSVQVSKPKFNLIKSSTFPQVSPSKKVNNINICLPSKENPLNGSQIKNNLKTDATNSFLNKSKKSDNVESIPENLHCSKNYTIEFDNFEKELSTNCSKSLIEEIIEELVNKCSKKNKKCGIPGTKYFIKRLVNDLQEDTKNHEYFSESETESEETDISSCCSVSKIVHAPESDCDQDSNSIISVAACSLSSLSTSIAESEFVKHGFVATSTLKSNIGKARNKKKTILCEDQGVDENKLDPNPLCKNNLQTNSNYSMCNYWDPEYENEVIKKLFGSSDNSRVSDSGYSDPEWIKAVPWRGFSRYNFKKNCIK